MWPTTSCAQVPAEAQGTVGHFKRSAVLPQEHVQHVCYLTMCAFAVSTCRQDHTSGTDLHRVLSSRAREEDKAALPLLLSLPQHTRSRGAHQ